MKIQRSASRPWNALLVALATLPFVACGGGGGGGGAPGPSPAQSSISVGTSFGTPADGTSAVPVSILIADKTGKVLPGVPVELRAGGYGTVLTQPVVTDAQGRTSGSIASSAPETKSIQVVVNPGTSKEQILATVQTTFVEILPNARYVSESGSDGNDGRTPLTAWRTLPFAASQLGAGETLFVGPGLYAPFSLSQSGTVSAPIVIRGDVDGTYTGDAGDVVIDAGGGDFGVQVSGADHVILDGLTIRGAMPAAGSRGGGVWFPAIANEGCAILNCNLYENARGADIEYAKDFVFENNRVSQNRGPGLVLGTTTNAQIAQSLIYANDAEGLLLEGLQQNLFVGLTTFYQNGGDQILEMATAGSTGRIADNIVSEGAANALSFQPSSLILAENNMSWGHTGSEVQLGAPTPLNIVADPLLSDPAGLDGILGGIGAADDDFRLLAGSPAFDAGDLPANQSSLRYGGTMVNYTSRVDGVREAIAPDGAVLNLGYHDRGALDGFTSSDPAGGRVSYVLPGEAVLRSSARSSTGSYASTIRAQDVGSEVRWVVQALTPGRPDEWTAVLSDTGAGTRIDVRHWNGRHWSEGWGSPVVSRILPQNTGERGFDLAVESLSGDALLVRSDNDSNPVFRTYSAGTWSDDAPVFSPNLGAGVVLWVELVSDPQSDRIALVALDDQQYLTAAVWDGSAWTSPIVLGTQAVSLREFKPFDAAFESQSGDLLVMWGFSVFAEQARFATLTQGGNWAFGTHTSTEAVGSTVKLSADPTTDRIVAILGEGTIDDDVAVALWGGSAWTDTLEVTLNGVPGQHALAAGWIGTTGRAVAVWREPSQPGTLMTARFDDFWRIEGAQSISGVGSALGVELRSVPGSSQAEAVILDDTGSLFSASIGWNGTATTWQVGNSGQAIGAGLDGSLPTRTFAFELRQP